MTTVKSKRQLNLARIALAALMALILLGLVLNGISGDVIGRGWHNILQRSGGPMSFRFILQPAVAALAALHDGIKDARTHQPPYIWTMLTNPATRGPRLREGLIATARIILLGLAMDAIYQTFVLHEFYPGEMAIVAVLLAFLPYLVLRGPMGRLAHWWFQRKSRLEKP
jgi:hypothetical protein